MLDNTIIGYSNFLMCFNVFSFIHNLNYFDIADLVIFISNYSFNIMSLSSLMPCSFLWFLSFEVWFLKDNIDIQFVRRTTSPSLYLFLSKCRFLEFLAVISIFIHQTSIIIIVHHMFGHFFSSYMLPATIVEIYKLQKI